MRPAFEDITHTESTNDRKRPASNHESSSPTKRIKPQETTRNFIRTPTSPNSEAQSTINDGPSRLIAVPSFLLMDDDIVADLGGNNGDLRLEEVRAFRVRRASVMNEDR